MSVDLEYDVSLNGEALDITIYEDTDGDGTAENSETVSCADGQNTVTLSTIDGAQGNDVWPDVQPSTTTDTASPTLHSLTVIGELNLTVDAVRDTEVDLSWSDQGASSYTLRYSETSGTSFSNMTDVTTTSNTSATHSSLENGEQYFYKVRNDDSGEISNETSGTTTLPGPSGTGLDTSVEDEITVTWSNNDNSTDGNIEVYRSQDGTLGTEITGGLAYNATSYTDAGLEDGEQYHYTVRRNTDHRSSDGTQVSGVTVLPAPSNLSGDTSVEDEISLDWSKNDDSSDGDWLIERSEDGFTTSTTAGTVAPSTTSYTDGGLEDGEQYDYRVTRRTDHASADTTVTGLITVLPAPSNLTLDTYLVGEIGLDWTRNDDSSDGDWRVYRSQDGSTGEQRASGLSPTTTTYTDEPVESQTTYYYTVERSTDHATASVQESATSGGIAGETVGLAWHSSFDWVENPNEHAVRHDGDDGRSHEQVELGFRKTLPHLVAYYSFHEQNDTLGDKYNGYGTTVDAATEGTDVTYGHVGINGTNAWRFLDTTDAYVALPMMDIWGTTSIGLIGVFQPEDTGSSQFVLRYGGDDDYEQFGLVVRSDYTSLTYGVDDTHQWTVNTNEDLTSQWNVVGITYDEPSDEFRMYHNGSLIHSVTPSFTPVFYNGLYRVGSARWNRAAAGDNIQPCKGYVSESLWFDGPLPGSVMTELYDALTAGSFMTTTRRIE